MKGEKFSGLGEKFSGLDITKGEKKALTSSPSRDYSLRYE
jgi:hypothetical protein